MPCITTVVPGGRGLGQMRLHRRRIGGKIFQHRETMVPNADGYAVSHSIAPHAAVDVEDFTGDEPGIGAGEKGDGSCHLPRPDPSDR